MIDNNTTKEQLIKELQELRKRNAELEKTELKRYKELFDYAVDGVCIHDFEGNIIEVNEKFAEITGYMKEDLLNLSINDLFESDQIQIIKDMEKKILVEEKAQIELVLKMKEGNLIPVDCSCRIANYLGIKCLLSVIRDISESKKLQDRLIRSERLAATGKLAADFAHEINSPLQAIIVMLSMLEKDYKENIKISENISLLKEAFGRIKKTVENMLNLNRPGTEIYQIININNIIENTVELVKSHLKINRIKVTLDLSPKIPDITASPLQLNQVFLNLINNAVEALSDVLIRKKDWGNRAAVRKEITFKTNLRKQNIIIIVSDTGPGFQKETFNSVFDPFYTGKKKVGMGLGLSICYGIIEDHNGTIAAKNSPEGGAVITITLPVT